MQKLFLPPPTNLPAVSALDLVPPVPTTALIPNLLESMPPWDASSKYFLSACVAPYGFSRFTLKSPATSSLAPMGRLLMVVTKSFMEEVSSRAIQHPMICHLFCSFPIRKMDMFGPSKWINFKVIALPYSRIPQRLRYAVLAPPTPWPNTRSNTSRKYPPWTLSPGWFQGRHFPETYPTTGNKVPCSVHSEYYMT